MASVPTSTAVVETVVVEKESIVIGDTVQSIVVEKEATTVTFESAPASQPQEGPEAAGKPKKEKKEKKSKENKQKPAQKPAAPELPFYQSLGLRLYTDSQKETIVIPPKPKVSKDVVPEDDETRQSRSKTNTSEHLNPPAANSLLVPSTSRGRDRSSSRASRRGDVSDVEADTDSMSDLEQEDPSFNPSLKDNLYTLDDFKRLEAINYLIAKYGSVSHMSVRDPSYSFWINRTRTAAVHFKLLNKVAVLAGDPLCSPAAMPATLEEFERYCRKAGWKTSIIGASDVMLEIAKVKKWPAMRFGTEKVLNPMTNEVLLGKSGKRTVVQCRQLLEPTKGGLTLNIYKPEKGRDLGLEAELTKIYDEWRGDRNMNRDCQAFITVFEMFSLPNIMTFIYTRNPEGAINGFAALRKMGNDPIGRYHIDPFIQSATAPRGTSDLLIYASLAYLHTLGSTYMGLGHEPVNDPDVIYNMNSLIIKTTRRVYRHIFGRLPVGGKETFNSRWKPDTEQEAGLYLIFIGRKTPNPKHLLAMTHFANISLRSVLKADWKDFKQELKETRQPHPAAESPDPTANTANTANTASAVSTPPAQSTTLPERPARPKFFKNKSSPGAVADPEPLLRSTASM